MVTKTFICDLCKKSVGETDLVPIETTVSMPKSASGCTQRLTAKKDVCKDCLEKKGILMTITDEKQRGEITTKNEKTLEDKFVDLLVDLGVVFSD